MTKMTTSKKTAMVPVTQETIQVIQSIAPVAHATRMYDVTEEQAMMIMLKGWELGLGMSTSFEFIDVINGRPSIKPKGAIALIQQSGALEEMRVDDKTDDNGNPYACTVYMERTNGFAYEVTFTMDDAKKAGLIKPDSAWEKYSANMLRWRAVGYCADIVFPDAIGGLYRPEELGVPVNRGGAPLSGGEKDVVEGAVVAKDDKGEAAGEPEDNEGGKPEEPEEIVSDMTLDDILDAGYTADEIVAANKSKIPTTSEECQKVLEALEVG